MSRVPSFAASFLANAIFLVGALAGCTAAPRVAATSAGGAPVARAEHPAPGREVGSAETVATCDGPMWTGVTVSRKGRIFVSFPRWGDDAAFTVAEIKGGKPVAYPDAGINHLDPDHPADHLISVQSVVADSGNLLWALDTGSVQMRPAGPGAAKLVAIDLDTDKVVRTIVLPPDVVLPTTYLNDVRFNTRQGSAGFAFITDSGAQGPNGIVVIDLGSGKSRRKLTGHPSVRAENGFTATVEGKLLLNRPAPGVARPVTVGADGIALSADGKTLFYCPMSGRHLYGVSTEALADPALGDDVAKTVVDYGDRGYASDGLETDAAGRLYLTDYEHNAVHRRTFGPAGPGDVKDEVLVRGPELVWPDTLCVAADGYLYFTANQLNRQKQYNEGVDLRRKPYLLLRTRINSFDEPLPSGRGS